MARILVIDDETNIRMMIRLALQHVGHTVHVAVDGYDGLRTFRHDGPWDLVLLDQRMPGMEGLEVLKEIREREPKARVIMITAFGTINLAVDAMKAGASDFLRKPFTAETLRNAVAAALTEQVVGSHPDISDKGITFGSTTLNGYRIEYQSGQGKRDGGETRFPFTIRTSAGLAKQCIVVLPVFVKELVKAHTGLEEIPHSERFWESLCETELANFLWQNSAPPETGELRVTDLTPTLQKWVDAALGIA